MGTISSNKSILERLLEMVLLILLVSIMECNSISCRASGSNPDSLLYGLAITKDTAKQQLVIVYQKNCPQLNTTSASWYRLEVIGSYARNGSFNTPHRASGAEIKNDGIEFYAFEEPLALLDFPRTFSWKSSSVIQEILCFRLTVLHEDSCEQVISSNCTAVNDTEVSKGAGSYPGYEAQKDEGSAEESTNAVLPEQTETTTSPLVTSECFSRHDCSGKRKAPQCGTDGKVYRNRCELRLYSCLDGTDVQRDKTWAHCPNATSDEPCTTTQPPTSAATEAPTRQPCVELNKQYEDKPWWTPRKCDRFGFFRPILCRAVENGAKCWCVNTRYGSVYREPWIVSCNNHNSSEIPQHRCGL